MVNNLSQCGAQLAEGISANVRSYFFPVDDLVHGLDRRDQLLQDSADAICHSPPSTTD